MTEPGFKAALAVSSDRIDSNGMRLNRVTWKVVSPGPRASSPLHSRDSVCQPGAPRSRCERPGSRQCLSRRRAVLVAFVGPRPEEGRPIPESSLNRSGHPRKGRWMELGCVRRVPARADRARGRSSSDKLTGGPGKRLLTSFVTLDQGLTNYSRRPRSDPLVFVNKVLSERSLFHSSACGLRRLLSCEGRFGSLQQTWRVL